MWSYYSQKQGLQIFVNARGGPEVLGAALHASNLCSIITATYSVLISYFSLPEVDNKRRLILWINNPLVERLFPDFPDLAILSLFPELLQITISELFQFRANRTNWETLL